MRRRRYGRRSRGRRVFRGGRRRRGRLGTMRSVRFGGWNRM